MGFPSKLAEHKYLVGMGILCAGFVIATIVLGVQVSQLNSELGLAGTDTTTPGTATTTTVNPNRPGWEKDYRLPEHIVPLSYDILLHPDLEAGTFKGTVTIRVACTSECSYIPVHEKHLNITRTTLTHVHDTKHALEVSTVSYEPNEFWVVVPETYL